MNLSDKDFINIVERAEIIFDIILKKLNIKQILSLKNEIDNLPIDQYVTNQLIIDRINYLKPKKIDNFINNILDDITSDENNFSFDFTNDDIFIEAKNESKKISNDISYFSSGELKFLKDI